MKNKPYVTYTIFGITTAVFLIQFLIPYDTVERLLGMSSLSIAYGHQYWRFITPIFIHFGLMHFAFNMVVLYFMGQQCEAIFGHWRFAIVYLLSGITGSVAGFAFNQTNVLSGGASGAIFGIFGGFLMIGLHYRDNYAMRALTKQFTIFILLNLVFNLFDTSIDIWGHIGGLIGGGLLGAIVGIPGAKGRFSVRTRIVSAMLLIFFTVICILIGLRKVGLA